MEKETMMSDKDLSWFLGVEDETENESTSQEATAVPERERPTNKQDTENTMHSEPARNTENVTVQKRISAKMRKKTLEAYKQAYLVPTKLNNRKAVYLSRETQERTDFIVRISYDIQKQSTVSKNHSTDFFIQSSEIMSIDE
ncbi:DUF3408 domain-containing protein [Prevotella nigrescens]|uniref:DUF3408 domain-containing protein n=1 Tax=Prevotella nigrescens TaxID=28133 RepID=UPI00241EF01E|nr:DUF3408 domain-containing protein [Prevotella nigrescens]